MKRLHLLPFVCLLFTGMLCAQQRDGPNRWYVESYNSLTRPNLLEGEEYTTPRYNTSQVARLIYRLPVAGGVSVATGLGIGLRNISQRSRADLYDCRLGPQPEACQENITHWVDVKHLGAFFELPVYIRYLPGRDDNGLYITVGTAAQLPLFESVESVRKQRRSGGGTMLAEEEVRDRIVQLLSTGIGYQHREVSDITWYIELTYSQSTGAVVEGDPDRDPFRIRYFRDAGVRQLGITIGLGF